MKPIQGLLIVRERGGKLTSEQRAPLASPQCTNLSFPYPASSLPLSSLSRNPLWSVLWQQLHRAASQMPINQRTSVLSRTNTHANPHLLQTPKECMRADEDLPVGRFTLLSGARTCGTKWVCAEEQWCQRVFMLVQLCLTLSDTLHDAWSGRGSGGRAVCREERKIFPNKHIMGQSQCICTDKKFTPSVPRRCTSIGWLNETVTPTGRCVHRVTQWLCVRSVSAGCSAARTVFRLNHCTGQ